MRALLQRVNHASVTVDDAVVGAIDAGLLILLGVGAGDTEPDADRLADKVVNLRVFRDAEGAGRFDRSLLDVAGGALVVSQFTLFADCRKGRRPSFTDAARPEHADALYGYFADRLKSLGVARVERGRFAASMAVELVNDGPVTIWLDTAAL